MDLVSEDGDTKFNEPMRVKIPTPTLGCRNDGFVSLSSQNIQASTYVDNVKEVVCGKNADGKCRFSSRRTKNRNRDMFLDVCKMSLGVMD
jgi:hypothetical protein